MCLGWFWAKLKPLLYIWEDFFVTCFQNFRHSFSLARMGSAPETRSWMDNWSYQKKMNILRVADSSVTLLEEAWLKNLEKYRKCCDFRDFWWFFTNSGGGRSGCGPKISTYILFGSISTQNVRFWNNLAWSRGLRSPRSKSTAPGPRGVCLVRAGVCV